MKSFVIAYDEKKKFYNSLSSSECHRWMYLCMWERVFSSFVAFYDLRAIETETEFKKKTYTNTKWNEKRNWSELKHEKNRNIEATEWYIHTSRILYIYSHDERHRIISISLWRFVWYVFLSFFYVLLAEKTLMHLSWCAVCFGILCCD